MKVLSTFLFLRQFFFTYLRLEITAVDCDTIDFYKPELLNFDFNQPEQMRSLYYELEHRSCVF